MDDLRIAQKYVGKAQRAAADGIEFKLSFTAFKNMMRAAKCGYTGVRLTDPRKGMSPRATDRTIDRIDSQKGYVSGNVIVCCYAANQFKSIWENPSSPLKPKNIRRMMDKLERLSGGRDG